ncbi:hypothetical protein [Paraburkholderia saeva]|uniref:Uncharacterized protein n=1 Tax=Paraburkholderia saeva TaxID=2777537 RepID=A0A9N8S2J8_9BURK|nr:hypothetical protein [Paraburkholderia saeva]CAG4928267.1 hypothetical protein LMG31841_05798 [Paraburkholderia saeva]
MILRPEQLRLMAMGLPTTPANKSSDSTSRSDTTNQYADQRNAVQGGVGVSGNGNTTYNSSTTTDDGAVTAAMNAMIAAINGNSSTAAAAVNANSSVASTAITSTTAASNHLEDVGLSMLQANTALANSLTGGALQSAQQTTQIAADLAKTQVAAQNDNRYLIAAGIAVVAIVGVAAFNKGHA